MPHRSALFLCSLCSTLMLLGCANDPTAPMTRLERPGTPATEADSSLGLRSPVYRSLPFFPFPPASAVAAVSLPRAALTTSASGTLIDGPELLQVPEDALWSYAFGAASNGRIGGQHYGPPTNNYHPETWGTAGAVEPFPLGSFPFGYVYDVNSDGIGVGWTFNGSTAIAIQWAPGGAVELALPPGVLRGEARAINDAGVIVGFVTNSSGLLTAIRWSSHGSPEVLSDSDCLWTAVLDVNEAGTAAGYGNCGGAQKAFIWEPNGSVSFLGSPEAGVDVYAYGLNDQGQVVGQAYDPGPGTSHGVRWDSGTPTILAVGGYGWGWRINDAGFVLGYDTYFNGSRVLWGPDGAPMGELPGGFNTWAEDLEGSTIAGYAYDVPTNRWTAARWTITTKLAQTITFEPLADAALGSQPLDLTATASSGLPVEFALGAASAGCSLQGSTLTLTGVTPPGTSCVVVASQPGDAGHEAAPDVTRSFRILYPFTGFFQPVDNPGANNVLNQVKAGSSIPVKFSLGGNRGLDILAPNSPTTGVTSCGSTPTIDPIEQTTTSSSGLHYDDAAGQYVYVWKTLPGWKGGCRRFSLILADGQVRSALFQFK